MVQRSIKVRDEPTSGGPGRMLVGRRPRGERRTTGRPLRFPCKSSRIVSCNPKPQPGLPFSAQRVSSIRSTGADGGRRPESSSKRLADPIVSGLQIQAELLHSAANLSRGPVELRLCAERFPALLKFGPFILGLHRAEMNFELDLVACGPEIVGELLKVWHGRAPWHRLPGLLMPIIKKRRKASQQEGELSTGLEQV